MSAIPTITMHKVESSQFAAIGHVPELNLLAIQFHPKKSGESDIYHYQNVGADMFAEFLGAESQGSFFIQRIKKCVEQFPYEKVDQVAFDHTTPLSVARPLADAVAAPALTKELLALALNGREYPFDLTKDEEAQAKAAGLVVIFGASDDLMELRGAIYDEFGCYEGGTALIDANGLLPNRDCIEDDGELRDYFFSRAAGQEGGSHLRRRSTGRDLDLQHPCPARHLRGHGRRRGVLPRHRDQRG